MGVVYLKYIYKRRREQKEKKKKIEVNGQMNNIVLMMVVKKKCGFFFANSNRTVSARTLIHIIAVYLRQIRVLFSLIITH